MCRAASARLGHPIRRPFVFQVVRIYYVNRLGVVASAAVQKSLHASDRPMPPTSQSSLSTSLRSRLARQLKGRRSKRRARHLRFESLEDRRLLAVDWRNPVNSLDISGDGFISPVDPLQVINELNLNGPHELAAQRPSANPYWDASGD